MVSWAGRCRYCDGRKVLDSGERSAVALPSRISEVGLVIATTLTETGNQLWLTELRITIEH